MKVSDSRNLATKAKVTVAQPRMAVEILVCVIMAVSDAGSFVVWINYGVDVEPEMKERCCKTTGWTRTKRKEWRMRL